MLLDACAAQRDFEAAPRPAQGALRCTCCLLGPSGRKRCASLQVPCMCMHAMHAQVLCEPFFSDRKDWWPEGAPPYYESPFFHYYANTLAVQEVTNIQVRCKDGGDLCSAQGLMGSCRECCYGRFHTFRARLHRMLLSTWARQPSDMSRQRQLPLCRRSLLAQSCASD